MCLQSSRTAPCTSWHHLRSRTCCTVSLKSLGVRAFWHGPRLSGVRLACRRVRDERRVRTDSEVAKHIGAIRAFDAHLPFLARFKREVYEACGGDTGLGGDPSMGAPDFCASMLAGVGIATLHQRE